MKCHRCGREAALNDLCVCDLCQQLFCEDCLRSIGERRPDGLLPGTYCRTCLGDDADHRPPPSLPWPLEPDRVYVMCTRTDRRPIGQAIQWITRHASESYLGARGWAILSPHAHLGPYSHMAILSTWRRADALCAWAPEGLPPATGTVYEATERGFVATELADYHTPGTSVDVFELPDLTAGAAIAIIQRCEDMVALGVEYDFAQLIGVGLGRFVWGAKRLRITNLFGTSVVICSEGTAVIIRDCAAINICGRYHLSVFCPTDIRHSCDIGATRFVGTIDWQPRTAAPTSRAPTEL